MISNAGLIYLLVLFGLIIFLQVLLSLKEKIIYGLVMPLAFVGLFAYNLYKSFYILNPHPDMGEGMLMMFSIVGFSLTVLTFLITKLFKYLKLKF
jgi:hypothetical protein